MKNSIQLGLAGLIFMAFFGLSLNQHLRACSLSCVSNGMLTIYTCPPGRKCKEVTKDGEAGLSCGRLWNKDIFTCQGTGSGSKGNV
ncbi:MAG: hypothetical protein AAFR61_10510 [Bacteroidota bacterium]